MDDEFYICEAIKEAKKALSVGEVPVGCIIAHGDGSEKKIIGRAHNQVETLKDATAHAEMIAITQAAGTLGDWRLDEATLYVTKEPCPMCAGAMVNSRIKRLVFGVSDPLMGAAGGLMNIVEDIRVRHQAEVVRGVKEKECKELLQEFFSGLRGRVAESG